METNLSFWEKDTYLSNIDVAVVGGGIVGLNAAIHLKKKHKKLFIIAHAERQLSCDGPSCGLRNIGLISRTSY